MEIKAFGKYQILERIGKGGFGEVFKGRDPVLNRFVAVKTCSSQDAELRQRFFREAEIAANLQHPSIVTIFDFGYQQETPYLVQEYLRGEDLERKIARRDPLPEATKVDYLRQIAAGLEYAHSRDVIHRDVKAANVRVLADGQIKIMDFGIAKVLSEEHGLTRTGTALGTAAYMPPEQLRGEKVDQRGDLFSFGVLAYELLTYARPFTGESLSAVLYAIAHQEPHPISSRWPECPPRLATMIERCLRKDPAERYTSFAEVLPLLEPAPPTGETALPPPPPPPPPPPAAAPVTSPPSFPTDAATIPDVTLPTTEKTVPDAPPPPPVAAPVTATAPAPAAKPRWRRALPAVAIGCAAVALMVVAGLLGIAILAGRQAAGPEPQSDAAATEPEAAEPAATEPTEPSSADSEPETEPPEAEEAQAGPDEPSSETAPNEPPPEPKAPTQEPVPSPRVVRPQETSPGPAATAEDAPAVPRVVPPRDAAPPSTPPATPRPATPIVSPPYGVELGSLAPGQRVYADRAYEYERVPAAFLRLPCLRTFQDRKLAAGSFSFTANRAVEVFVAHDQRIKRKPAWLKAFRNTGQVLTVNEGGREQKTVAYQVFTKAYPPGTIRLGANVAPRTRKRSLSMYVVFVRPR